MSTKFEQLLDYLVNEEMDKANELFHEIVVEKSRSIYENLIAEEEQEDESVEEAAEDDDQDESVEETMDLEDSYMMDGDDDMDSDEEPAFGGDATDELGADTMDEPSGDSEEDARDEIEAAIAELTAALEKLGGSADDSMDDMDDMGDVRVTDDMDSEVGDEDEGRMFEGRRMTREYTETVGVNWDKNSQKTQGQIAGANTGEKMPNATENNSPISKGSGKPTTGATAANILGSKSDAAGTNTGTTPGKVSNGIAKTSGDKFAKGMQNVDGVKSGVKTLSKQPGHGPEKKGTGEGQPAGAGTGEKASGAVNAKSIVDSKIG
jgi:hypothetical protein